MIDFSNQNLNSTVLRWCDQVPAFAKFVEANQKKIAGKISRAKDFEQTLDFLAELETAKQLLSNVGVQVAYEPAGKEQANPDLQVMYEDNSAYVEVKRVRPTEACVRQAEFYLDLIERLRKIPSNCGINLSHSTFSATSNHADHLLRNRDEIFRFCESELLEANRGPFRDDVTKVLIPNGDGLELVISHIAGKDPSTATANLGAFSPQLYTQRESFKYTDQLCACLRQLKPDSPNILVLWVSSDTHDARELPDAIRELERRVKRTDDQFFIKKGFDSTRDFQNQFLKLSATCAIPKWCSSTVVCINEPCAHKVPDGILALFHFAMN